MTLRQKQWMLLLFLLAGLLLLLLYPEMWGKVLGLVLFLERASCSRYGCAALRAACI